MLESRWRSVWGSSRETAASADPARTCAAWWGMSGETTAPCCSRPWGEDEDEEVDGRWSDAAPIALQGHRPELRGGKGEAAVVGEGRGGGAESGASPCDGANGCPGGQTILMQLVHV
jgi:hypothetical protein